MREQMKQELGASRNAGWDPVSIKIVIRWGGLSRTFAPHLGRNRLAIVIASHIGLAATFISQEIHERLHTIEACAVEKIATLAPRQNESGVLQLFQVK